MKERPCFKQQQISYIIKNIYTVDSTVDGQDKVPQKTYPETSSVHNISHRQNFDANVNIKNDADNEDNTDKADNAVNEDNNNEGDNDELNEDDNNNDDDDDNSGPACVA